MQKDTAIVIIKRQYERRDRGEREVSGNFLCIVTAAFEAMIFVSSCDWLVKNKIILFGLRVEIFFARVRHGKRCPPDFPATKQIVLFIKAHMVKKE